MKKTKHPASMHPFSSIEEADEFVLTHIRGRAAEAGCRIEVGSDKGDMPVSASSESRRLYGFGKTISEAIENLKTDPRRVPD